MSGHGVWDPASFTPSQLNLFLLLSTSNTYAAYNPLDACSMDVVT